MLHVTKDVFKYDLPFQIIPQKKGGFVVTCPVWADCYAQGNTVDEAVLEITAVAQSLIELYKEEGLKIPLATRKKENISTEITVPIIVSA